VSIPDFSKRWANLQKSPLLKTLVRGTGAAVGVKLFSAVLLYGTQVLLARWLGVVEYGVYDFAIALSLSLSFMAGLGFPSATLRFIAQYRVQKDWAHLRGMMRGGWQQTLLASMIVALISSTVLQGLNSYPGIDYSTSLFLGIWLMPVASLMAFQQNVIRGFQNITLAFAPGLFYYPLLLTVIASLWRSQWSLTGTILVGLSIPSMLLILLVQFLQFRRSLTPDIYRAVPAYDYGQWWRVALPLLLSDGSSVVLNQTDTLMLGTMLDAKAVGIYSAALKTSTWVSFILSAVNAIAAPMFASLYTQEDLQGLQRLVSTIARWIFYPALAIAIGLVIFADPVLRLFGNEFVVAKGSLIALILGNLVNVGAGSVGYLLMMTGYQVQLSRVMGVSALVNVVLNLVGIHYLGGLGAAIATAFSMALWNIWLHAIVVKRLDVHPSILAAFR
jgi:O-antigen/teichoic acid export membrane protein